jgi:hypothetical protein
MADHNHKAGEYMVSYRMMKMQMEGLIDGSSDISSGDLFDDTSYTMAPEDMEMFMHMAGIMYAPNDDWTFMMMLPVISSDMNMASKMMMNSNTDHGEMDHGGHHHHHHADMMDNMSMSSMGNSMDSSGLGDISFSALRNIFETEDERLLVSLGLVTPTGSIEETHNTSRMTYPMQLGTGSFRFKPGVVYSKYYEDFSIGAQAVVDHVLNENKNDYKVGDKYLVNLWGSYKLNEELSTSLRWEWKQQKKTRGKDSNINSMMSPAGDVANSGKISQTVFGGLNYMPQNFLKGHRVAFEIGIPVKQSSSGPQMKDKYIFILGWQKAWK